MRPSWIKIAVVLGIFWLIVGGAIWVVQRNRPTPTRIVEFVEANPIGGKSADERTRVIDQVAAKVNKLSFEERQEMGNKRLLDSFFKTLSTAEQSHYLDLVLSKGFSQLMAVMNSMEPDKRRHEVAKAVKQLKESADDGLFADLDPAVAQKIINDGLTAFYNDATIGMKMDAMPFLEALERQVKWNP